MLKEFFYNAQYQVGFDDLETAAVKFQSGLFKEAMVANCISIQATPGTKAYINYSKQYAVVGINGILQIHIPEITQVAFDATSPVFAAERPTGAFIRVLANFKEVKESNGT